MSSLCFVGFRRFKSPSVPVCGVPVDHGDLCSQKLPEGKLERLHGSVLLQGLQRQICMWTRLWQRLLSVQTPTTFGTVIHSGLHFVGGQGLLA